MYHNIEQLKEEIKEKDTELIRQHCEHHKVIKHYDSIRDTLSATKKRHTQLNSITELQRKEIRKIEMVISQAEAEKLNQKKEFAAVLGQRNILATQLMRRNEELALVHERIKIQGSTL